MKTISQFASDRTFTVSADHSVRSVARYMSQSKVGAVPVLEGGRVVGIFSERDLMTRVVAAGRDPDATRVEEVMTREVAVAEAGEPYGAALKRMQQVGCRHLPVVKDDRLIGMVSLRDLLQVEMNEITEEVRMMQSYVFFIPPGSGNA
jgi:CBS domain-containing protein